MLGVVVYWHSSDVIVKTMSLTCVYIDGENMQTPSQSNEMLDCNAACWKRDSCMFTFGLALGAGIILFFTLNNNTQL